MPLNADLATFDVIPAKPGIRVVLALYGAIAPAYVIPAKAGMHVARCSAKAQWIPAFARMTSRI